MKKIKNYLFHFGVVIFSLTMFLEHLLVCESNITNAINGFAKGFACGLILVGVIVLIRNTKK